METVANVNIPRREFGFEEHQIGSPNLREVLRAKEDDVFKNGGPTDIADHTLNSGLNSEQRGGGIERLQSSRTLRDIFLEDPHTSSKDNKKVWKNFKDKLIRRQGSGSNWTSSVPIPASDVPIHPQNSFRNITRWDSTRISSHGTDGSDHQESDSGPPRSRSAILQRNASRAIERPRVRFQGLEDEPEEDETLDEGMQQTGDEGAKTGEEEEGGGGEGEGEVGEGQVRMSLMALLAETDKQMGIDGSSYTMEEDDEEEEEESGGDYKNCCVCMVRHKGAAFIPCGHTFCRLCSRELWVQRGNCPLCNNFILEILDIF